MQIPYEVSARQDTGLYNAKLGIWLFLASEVMLFGGLFSAYIFQRIGAEPGYWPHGLLNVPVGMGNTIVLIASSVTIVLLWAALKMRRYAQYQVFMLITILCGILFLVVKLAYEWPQKFSHFGVFIKKDAIEKYDDYLGNKHLKEEGREPRYEISGHLHSVEVIQNGQPKELEMHSPGEFVTLKEEIANRERALVELQKGIDDLTAAKKKPEFAGKIAEFDKSITEQKAKLDEVKKDQVTIESIEMALDEVNAEPNSEANDRPAFFPRELTEKKAVIHFEDIENNGSAKWEKWAGAFLPNHSTYFGTYFLITGLHGLHVLGGVIVFSYMFLFGKKLYLRNPEHMANRVEVAGLFWHFVDLVWIFVFPIFYLL